MTDSAVSRSFLVLRGLIYSAGFVVFWTWVATSVRPWDDSIPFGIPAWSRTVGFELVPAGALLTAWSILTFITRGRGTPAPFDAPREFVASGPYRYVRNPMYIGAALVILGFGLIVSSPAIVLLAAAFLVTMHLVVVVYEEPTLESKFGESYRRYRAAVRRWMPRMT